MQKQFYSESQAELRTMVAEQNQREATKSQLRSTLPDWDEGEKKRNSELIRLNVDVENCRETGRASLRELRQLVDATKAKYKDLAGDDQIMHALKSLRLKLGPSSDFNENAKWLKENEKKFKL